MTLGVLMAACIWLLWDAPRKTDLDAPSPRAENQPANVRATQPERAAAPTHLGEARVSVEGQAEASLAQAPPNSPSIDRLTLTGRAVDRAGLPVEGVAVTGWLSYPSHASESFEITTDSTGRFEITSELGEWVSDVQLRFEAEGRVRLSADVALAAVPAQPDPGSANWPRIDLGDFPSWHGDVLHGNVVDLEGLPMPDVELVFERIPPLTGSMLGPLWARRALPGGGTASSSTVSRNRGFASSGIDGRFRTTVLDRARYTLALIDSRLELLEPRDLVLDSAATPELLVRVARRARIEGVLMGPDGPLEGVDLTAAPASGNKDVKWASTRTRDAGKFEMWHRGGALEPMRLGVGVHGGYDLEGDSIANWGDHVLLFAHPRPRMVIEVVDRATGKRVPDFEVVLDAKPRPVHSISKDGRAVIPNLTPEPHTFHVSTPDVPAAGPFVAAPCEAPNVVELAPPATVAVRVRTAAGEPAEGATVELVARPAGALHSPYDVAANHWPALPPSNRAFPTSPLVWMSATTDADGRATLRQPQLEGWDVFVRAHRYRDGRAAAPLATSTRSLDLTLEPGARVTVTFEGAWPDLRILPSLIDLEADANLWPTESGTADKVRTFTFEDVAPGTFELVCIRGSHVAPAGRLTSDGRSAIEVVRHVDEILAPESVVRLPPAFATGKLAAGQLKIQLRPQRKGAVTYSGLELVPILDDEASLRALPFGTFEVEVTGTDLSSGHDEFLGPLVLHVTPDGSWLDVPMSDE